MDLWFRLLRAKVAVLHEGVIGREPIAVRVENVTATARSDTRHDSCVTLPEEGHANPPTQIFN